MADRPIKKWKVGNWEVAVWSNKRKNNGEELEFKTATLRRSWKDKQDIWRDETINIRRQDLPKILAIVNEMMKELYLTQEKEEDEENE